MELMIILLIVFCTFGYILKKVIEVAVPVNSIDKYLYAHDYMDDKSGLNKEVTIFTTIASNFQAANVFAVGLFLGFHFGILIAFLSFTFSAGLVFLYWLLLNLPKVEAKYVLESNRLPYQMVFFGKSSVCIGVVSFIVYFSVLSSAVFELWYGTIAVEAIVAPMIGQEFSGLVFPAVAICLAVLLFSYVYIGGYMAVAVSDKAQALLICGLLSVLVSGCILDWVVSVEFLPNNFFYGASGQITDFWLLVAIFVGATVMNVSWQLVSPQQWQRARSARNSETYIASLLPSALGVLFTWLLPVSVGAYLAGTVMPDGMSDGPYSSITIWFEYFVLQEDVSVVTRIFSAVLLGVCVAGVFAAALSTADTAIIAVVAKVIRLLPKSGQSIDVARDRAGAAVLFSSVFVAFLFYIEPEIEKMIFTISSAQMIFFPIFVAFVLKGGRKKIRSGVPSTLMAASFCLAFVTAIVANLGGEFVVVWDHWNYWLPAVYAIVGVLFVKFGMSDEHGDLITEGG